MHFLSRLGKSKVFNAMFGTYMMNKFKYEPLISIIVPVYNVCDYVGKCVESIVSQSYKNLQIILVDDGSSDGSGEICDSFNKNDKRIVVKHKKNGGLVSARKAGCELAIGEYILYVDGDDYIGKDRILHAVEYLQDEKYDILYLGGFIKKFRSYSVEVNRNFLESVYHNSEIEESFLPLIEDTKKFHTSSISATLVSFCFKAELLKSVQLTIDERISQGEDIICSTMAVLRASSIRTVKECSYYYIQRAESISHFHSSTGLRYLYFQLKSELVNKSRGRKLETFFLYLIYMIIILKDISILMLPNDDFLFPYPKIRKGSKVIVYGAGRMGQSVVQALSYSKDYSVVSFCDKNTTLSLGNIPVTSSAKIKDVDYDFLLIAVLNPDIAFKIKEELAILKVPNQKIALIDQSLLTEERLKLVFETE